MGSHYVSAFVGSIQLCGVIMGHSKRSISRRGKRTVEKWIAKLRKTGAFEFVSVVLLVSWREQGFLSSRSSVCLCVCVSSFLTINIYLQKPKPDLPMGADGCVDPFKVLPSHLHDAWRMAVAITQVWAAGMDESHPAVVSRCIRSCACFDHILWHQQSLAQRSRHIPASL